MGETVVYVKSFVIFQRRVLILQRSDYCECCKDEWDIPGGTLEFGETLLEGLDREVKEETGLTIRADKLLYAISHVKNQTKQLVGLTYLSHADTDEVTLSHEHTHYLWATKQQLKERLTIKTMNDYESNSVFNILDID